MPDMPVISVLRGADVTPFLDDVARLRIAVFRDWPYLYEGDSAYEREYLAAYAQSPGSVFVLARDGGAVVGASTGLPLVDDAPDFRQPFLDAKRDPAEVFYFGESVLLPAYRGRGLGHAFFDAREAHARALGRHTLTAFCAVDREAGDGRQPRAHRGNEPFWQKRGYTRQPELKLRLHWNEIGRGDIAHALTFWTRPLEKHA
ncbi:GNAT family N-acetyltransferase [Stenotrophomonas sp. HITSZ_GD]|uniref:GNAT family N-acetyltransferase n=1 Tax=Stenotrophomonas sp. HITSZ_GD TaxID=3037248 RepID=UPI00240D4A7F|nr:GNAT family N-acetyltransferase [Stenotrophomonas sp. HITSZ_GD]MDG2525605.1 GNAT family N-acetyltransferase [Stenotrophomonas sp. HITSZ_GD]